MKTKRCTKCNKKKLVKYFYKHKKGRHVNCCKKCYADYKKIKYWEAKCLMDYYRVCPECNTEFQAKRSNQMHCCKKCYVEYYIKNNKEKTKERDTKFYQKNKLKILKQQKEYRLNNKEKMTIQGKKYRIKHLLQLAKSQKAWRDSHREHINKYIREKYKNDPVFKIKRLLRIRINLALKANIKSSSTVFLTGCCVDYLMYHLQEQFKKGMSWDNHGRKIGIRCWEVDHIKPCKLFDLSKPSQQRKCFHYSNLQPLWAEDNLSKGSKYQTLDK